MEIIFGKTASELDQLFEEQSQQIQATPGLKFERTVSYVLVECDTELKRIPLNAKAIGLCVKADPENPDELAESFIFSLLLVTGTINQCTIDVPLDCKVPPEVVLQEAEAQGLNVRLLLPENTHQIEPVRQYADALDQYAGLWLQMQSGNFAVAPLDGYLEYKFARALGHQPEQITNNPEMQALFTDTLNEEAMNFIKSRLDKVIEEELGGDQFFVEQVEKVGAAFHLKNMELRNARREMLIQELDLRTPVPNLIRSVAKLSNLNIADAAGMVYEIKNSVHTILDKYLPRTEEEPLEKPAAAQIEFAESICGVLEAAFGGKDKLVDAWNQLSTVTQLKVTVDLDRGAVEPSDAAKNAGSKLDVEAKVAALALAELTAMFGSILCAGKAIDDIGLKRPTTVAEPKASNIIAVG